MSELSVQSIVQPYGAKKYPDCALRGKSTKLGKIKVLDFLTILSYGPHPNNQGGGVTMHPWGEGCNCFLGTENILRKELIRVIITSNYHFLDISTRIMLYII